MRYAVCILLVLLVVLHQDYWQWNDPSLLFGFLPKALAYHAGISLAAAAVWWLAIAYCWPKRLDESAEKADGEKARP